MTYYVPDTELSRFLSITPSRDISEDTSYPTSSTPILILPAASKANTSPSGPSLLPTYFLSEIPIGPPSPIPTPSRFPSLDPSNDPPGQIGPNTLSTPRLNLSTTTATPFKRPKENYSGPLDTPVDTP